MIEALFAYSVRSAIVLALLYVPYMLILRQESFFRLNRLVLLGILLLSLVLPALNVRFLAWDGFATLQTVLQLASAGVQGQPSAIELPEVAVQTASDASPSVSALHLMSIVFVLGMVAVALWRMCQLVQIGVVMKRGSLWQCTQDGINVYCHADDVAPYSWMNSVVISERDYRENGREILLHETAHIRALHSLDLIFLTVVQALQWWNPLVYILGGSLRDVHEYQADDSVLRHGISAKAYQLLLIKKVVGSSSYAFANNFNHSLIIKRITMMQKTKSSKWMCSKVLYILPMATLALSAFATVQPTGRQSEDTDGKVNTIAAHRQANGEEKALLTLQTSSKASASEDGKKKDGTTISVDPSPAVLPQFPGGEIELLKFLQTSVRYPKVAQEWGVQGKVVVQFIVKDDGSVVNPHVVTYDGLSAEDKASIAEVVVTAYAKKNKAQGKSVSAEDKARHEAGVAAIIEEAVRVVNEMPKWTPGYVDKEKTKPCNTSFSLPIAFRLG